MMPIFSACYFGPGENGDWARLARTCAYSAYQHCSRWDIRVTMHKPAPRFAKTGKASHSQNTQKMDEWHRVIQGLPDGAEVLLIDTDTLIVRPIDDVWRHDFDWAYTVKDSRFPYNSGVVFLRLNPRTRLLIDQWWAENDRLCNNLEEHLLWRSRYGGINQAALGYMLTSGLTSHLKALELPCNEWNCEDTSWEFAGDEPPRILHLKGRLRRAALSYDPRNPGRTNPKLRWCAATWHAYSLAAEMHMNGTTLIGRDSHGEQRSDSTGTGVDEQAEGHETEVGQPQHQSD